jgi:hypothetical protein
MADLNYLLIQVRRLKKRGVEVLKIKKVLETMKMAVNKVVKILLVVKQRCLTVVRQKYLMGTEL